MERGGGGDGEKHKTREGQTREDTLQAKIREEKTKQSKKRKDKSTQNITRQPKTGQDMAWQDKTNKTRLHNPR